MHAKAGKDFDHFMRNFGYPLFMEILIRDITLKRSKLFQGFFAFLAENGFKAGKDFKRLTWLVRMRISINRSGKEPYAGRIEILHIFTLLRFFGFSFCVFVVVFRLFAHSR